MATLIRKLIIEHADRYVFDANKSDVHLVRPRVVNLHAYTKEKDAWDIWHHEQSEAELNFLRSSQNNLISLFTTLST